MKKYILTSEIKVLSEATLFRIKRTSDGILGGWIQKESNLKDWLNGVSSL